MLLSRVLEVRFELGRPETVLGARDDLPMCANHVIAEIDQPRSQAASDRGKSFVLVIRFIRFSHKTFHQIDFDNGK